MVNKVWSSGVKVVSREQHLACETLLFVVVNSLAVFLFVFKKQTFARRACLLRHGGCLFDVRSCVLASRSVYLYTAYKLWSFDLRIPLNNNL